MALFIGTHQNKLDSKGRVSIPAHFRSVLKKMSHAGEASPIATIFLRPSHQHPCVEGWTELGFEALSAPVAQGYDLFSPEHEDFVLALFGDACAIETDREGRIMLPVNLIAHAGLADNVTFIGSRNTFQIWEPQAGARRLAEARDKTRAAGFSLRAAASPATPPTAAPPPNAATPPTATPPTAPPPTAAPPETGAPS